jgi:hypothetical protein
MVWRTRKDIAFGIFERLRGPRRHRVDVPRNYKVTTTNAIEAVFFEELNRDLVLDPVRVEVWYLSRG